MDELISIIVPVFNVEKYLYRCVESILNQSYLNLEIILVDDGSTDESGVICDSIKNMDNRIIVIHQKNKGVSEARNKGIEDAKGKYIGFVDADDYVESDMYKNLYTTIRQYDADVAVCGYYRESNERVEVRNCDYIGVLDRSGAYKALFNGKIGTSNCNKLFKRELFNEIKYKKIYQGEDLEVLYRILGKSNAVACTSAVSYHAVHRKGSASNSIFSDKRMDIVYVLEDMVGYIQRTRPVVLKEAYAYQLKGMLNMVDYMYLCMKRENFSSADEYKKYLCNMRKNKRYIYSILRTNMKHYCFNSYIYIGDYILFLGLLLHLYRPVRYVLGKGVRVYHLCKSI